LSLTPQAFTNGLVRLRAVGPSALALQWQVSSNLNDWSSLSSVAPFTGTSTLTDSNSPGQETRFYRAALSPAPTTSQQYVGNTLVFQGTLPPEYGPGSLFSVTIFNGTNRTTFSTFTDTLGLYTLAIDMSPFGPTAAMGLQINSADGQVTYNSSMVAIRTSGPDPAAAIPTNLAIDDSGPVEPDICTCGCGNPVESSLLFFDNSFTPADHNVELATGKERSRIPVLSFPTRYLGFDFELDQASMVSYAGPAGGGFSHSYNMMIVQNSPNSGKLITPKLRVYNINSTDGVNWTLPQGFESTLTLDPSLHRWALTHYSGFSVQFYQGATNAPGYPVLLSEPNGNTTTLAYNPSGFLQTITTDLGQTETLSYNTNGLLATLTDHIGRSWTFIHDSSNRLTQVISPVTEYASVPVGGEVIDTTLAASLISRGRTTTIGYADTFHPNYITSVTDDRGAVPQSWVYDSRGRVVTNFINGFPVVHVYSPTANPTPLALLDGTNMITRSIDREGNITDYEIHSRFGGPVGGAGAFGLRRKVTWTQSGQGHPALRPGEPLYYEQRWLQDCDCLSPQVVTQPFSSLDAGTLQFDANAIPMNWPRRIFAYNNNRQVTTDLYTDGAGSIQTTSTYQFLSFGQSGQYSRLLTRTDPRAYDTNAIYAGLNFVHTYVYDAFGNRTNHTAPTVTLGVTSPQPIVESWTYNAYGQMLSHLDPNGNLTTYAYYVGTSAGGNINTPGMYGGYRASMTQGAAGSADPVTSLTTMYRVDALGMVTEMTDPRSLVTDYQYDALGELILVTEPAVTLWTGQQVRYTTATFYDGAGNIVLTARTNVDYDNTVLAAPTVDVSRTYDAVNNLLSERRVVDANHADDLITRFAYNANDLRIASQKPLGNRAFTIYDERLLPLRSLYGIAPAAQLTNGYPASKLATNLGGTSFVGYRQNNYDSRANLVQMRDGRGYLTYRFYDFRNRRISASDPNGNGRTTEYDTAGNPLTIQAGSVSQTSGALTGVLSRSYLRYDEANRRYQTVNDGDLSGDESSLVDPSSPLNPGFRTFYDAGSRKVLSVDANGNPTSFAYDADNRPLSVTDALGNSATNTYDADGNMTALTEVEVAGPGSVGPAETYVTTYAYDGNNRQTQVHIRGLNGNSLDDHTLFAYDSRGNLRLVQDAATNFSLTLPDFQNRITLVQRYDGDPTSGSPHVLSRMERVYDLNGNVTEDHAFATATNPASIQITRYAYDNADRRIRNVFPDSDNPIDGSSNGPSGIFNRVEVGYDAEADPISVEDQRQVLFTNIFDPGRRLIGRSIALGNGVAGFTREQFGYDARNLLTDAANDYADVFRTYDDLGRMTNETQSIRLDGSAFTRGWEQPVSVRYAYDLQGSPISLSVVASTNRDLAINRTMDALNRINNVLASYFNISSFPVATYHYFGPDRVQTKRLGSSAFATNSYDARRRLSSLLWTGATNNLLVGFQYAYDSMDNPQFERWLHDNGDYDQYQYNHRYELTGVTYRSPGSFPPSAFTSTFSYNDNLDRSEAAFTGPFTAQPTNMDSYAINPADEYTNLTRNAVALNPAYDRAGNMTSIPSLPVTGVSNQTDVSATGTWDALNHLFTVSNGVTPVQNYRYDCFGRRIATLVGGSSTPERRFIYDNWTTVEERLFNPGATPANAPSTLERIYVDGSQMDEHLLTAIDRNGNGVLDSATLNNTDINADQWYYFLPNRLGSVAALLAANNPNQTLELYRYTAYGEATVLPAVPGDNTNLSVNFAQGWQRSSPEHGNFFLFTGQRFDDKTGLYYYRNRYYDARGGRFVSRDPLGQAEGPNRFQFTGNEPTAYSDPFGLWSFDFGGPSAPTPPSGGQQYGLDVTPGTAAPALWEFYHGLGRDHDSTSDSLIISGEVIDMYQTQEEVVAGQQSAYRILDWDANSLLPFLECGESTSFVARGRFYAVMDWWYLSMIGAFGTSSVFWEAHCQLGPKTCCGPDTACDSGKADSARYMCTVKWTLYKIWNFGQTGTGTGGKLGLFLKKVSHYLQLTHGTTFHLFGYWQTTTGGRVTKCCPAPACITEQTPTGDGTTTSTGTQSK
jgi:RHS repeat-associated protein